MTADLTSSSSATTPRPELGPVKVYLAGYGLLILLYLLYLWIAPLSIAAHTYVEEAFPGATRENLSRIDLLGLKTDKANRRVYHALAFDAVGGRRVHVEAGAYLTDRDAVDLAKAILLDEMRPEADRTFKELVFHRPGFFSNLPWPSILMVYNLLGLFLLLMTFVAGPVGQILENQAKGVREALAEAERTKREAEELKRRYEALLAEVEAEKKKLEETATYEFQEEREHILALAKHESETLLTNLRASLEAEVATSIDRLKREVAREAFAMAREILKEEIRPEDQDRAFEAMMAKLEKTKEQGVSRV